MLTIEKEIQEVVNLRNVDEGETPPTFEEIGKKLGFSEKTARRRYQAGIAAPTEADLVQPEMTLEKDEEVPEIKIKSHFLDHDKPEIKRFKPLVVTGDAMVTADYHIPLHDPIWLNVMINCAKKNGIKKLIIGGDYWNMDQFSSFLPLQPEASWEIERYEGNLIAKTLLKTFDEITFIWGNHDFRLTKSTGFKESFTDCMKWAFHALSEEEMSKIKFSDLDYMFYEPGDGRTYRVCHPKNFSNTPLSVPLALAVKYDCSIITAHSHHCALGVAPNSRDLVMEVGGFFDKKRTEYIQRTNTSHEWVQGFIMFKDGTPEVFSPQFNNFGKYKKEVKSRGKSKKK